MILPHLDILHLVMYLYMNYHFIFYYITTYCITGENIHETAVETTL